MSETTEQVVDQAVDGDIEQHAETGEGGNVLNTDTTAGVSEDEKAPQNASLHGSGGSDSTAVSTRTPSDIELISESDKAVERSSPQEGDVIDPEDTDQAALEQSVINLLEDIANSDRGNDEEDRDEEHFPAPPSEEELAAIPTFEPIEVQTDGTDNTGLSGMSEVMPDPPGDGENIHLVELSKQTGHEKDVGTEVVSLAAKPQQLHSGQRTLDEPGKEKSRDKASRQSSPVDRAWRQSPQKRSERKTRPYGGDVHIEHGGFAFDKATPKLRKEGVISASLVAWTTVIIAAIVVLAVVVGLLFYALDRRTERLI